MPPPISLTRAAFISPHSAPKNGILQRGCRTCSWESPMGFGPSERVVGGTVDGFRQEGLHGQEVRHTRAAVCMPPLCDWVMELNSFDFSAPIWASALELA